MMQNGRPKPSALNFTDIHPSGDLERRAMKNLDRMESQRYQPPRVFLTEEESNYWPGDTEGRTILALTLLAQALHREPRHLIPIINQFPSYMNEKGYFGTIHTDFVDEQQLSSHSWVLRGLCEYAEWTEDNRALAMIEGVVRQLALPTRGRHTLYPLDPSIRSHTGCYSGTPTMKEAGWRLSTDVGCDFLFLDGLTHAWKHLDLPDLRELIEEMITRFLEMDLITVRAQTHATLSALRALLRFASLTDDHSLVTAVESRYSLYRRQAMTETWANYNWFQRPEWTEPCAVIDSFMIAVQLWQWTGKTEYLADAHHIYWNALLHGQRRNGGMGPDSCTGAQDPFLTVATPEAHWCCTMRGGEGLSRAIQYSYFLYPDAIVVPFYHNSVATFHVDDSVLTLEQVSEYPESGRISFYVRQVSGSARPRIRFFAPSWMHSHHLMVNGQPTSCRHENDFIEFSPRWQTGDRWEWSFDLQCCSRPVKNPLSIQGYHSYQYGPLMLGVPTDKEVVLPAQTRCVREGKNRFRLQDTSICLSPINDLIDIPMDSLETIKRQVLFTTGAKSAE